MATIDITRDMGKKEIEETVAGAASGDVVRFEAGTYRGVDFRRLDFDAENPVTITSAPGGEAVFLGTTNVARSTGLAFEDVTFALRDGMAGPGGTYDARAVQIIGSEAITIAESTVRGDKIDASDPGGHDAARIGLSSGLGVYVKNSADVTVERSDLTTLGKGVEFFGAVDTTIAGNHFDDTREDVIRGGNHSGTTVTGNLMTGLDPYRKDPANPNPRTDEHADFIQYWGLPKGSGIDGFTITDNVMIDDGGFAQGIFGWNAHKGGGRDFTDFTVTGNVLYGGHIHGITIGDVRGATVANNTLMPNRADPSGRVEVPLIEVGGSSQGIVVRDNLVPEWDGRAVHHPSGGPPKPGSVQESGNVTFDGSGRPSEGETAHTDVFGALYGDGSVALGDLRVTASADVVPDGAGSALTRSGPSPDAYGRGSDGGGLQGVASAAPPAEQQEPAAPPAGPVIEGTAGDDSISGTAGDDRIEAGAGSDRIYAGAGDDRIDAGPGLDWVVRGGAGADVFVLSEGSQRVNVLDFEDGIDRIAIEGAGFEDLVITTHRTHPITYVRVEDRADTLTLSVPGDKLDAGDFLFG